MKFANRNGMAIIFFVILAGCQKQPVYSPDDFGRLPWHLAIVYWTNETVKDLEIVEMDLELPEEFPQTPSLFLVPIEGKINNLTFYIGLANSSEAQKSDDAPLQPLGRSLIFTKFGTKGLDEIKPSTGARYLLSNHEGPHSSVRVEYESKKGKYTVSLVRMNKETIGEKKYVWAGAFLRSHERNENIFIGAIRFEGERLELGERVSSFLEIPGGGKAQKPEKLPTLSFTLSNLRINCQAVLEEVVSVYYLDKVPQCTSFNLIRDEKKVNGRKSQLISGVEVRVSPKLISRKPGLDPLSLDVE